MAPRRSRSSDLAVRPAAGAGPRRGSVNVTRPLPRFVRFKTLASGAVAFYWDLTAYYRGLGCSIPGEPLGTDYVTACGEDGNGGRAAALNALFDEWRRSRSGEPVEGPVQFGTVDWLFREYKQTKAYLEKVSQRSRRDYERTMLLVTDLVTKKGTGSATERSKPLLPSPQTKFTSGSLPVHAGSDRARAKRLSACAHARGASCTASIPTFSTRTSRTRGAV